MIKNDNGYTSFLSFNKFFKYLFFYIFNNHKSVCIMVFDGNQNSTAFRLYHR